MTAEEADAIVNRDPAWAADIAAIVDAAPPPSPAQVAALRGMGFHFGQATDPDVEGRAAA